MELDHSVKKICFSAVQLLISYITVRGFQFRLTGQGLIIADTRSFEWLLLFLFILWTLSRSAAEKDRRLKGYGMVLSVIIAANYSIGLSFEKMENLIWMAAGGGNFIHYCNFSFSCFILCYCFVFLCFQKLRDLKWKDRKAFSYKRVLLFWAILLVFYIPWYQYCYPGVLTYDSGSQIRDALSVDTISDHHPALPTLMIRGILLPVQRFTGSVQTGVGICTFLQMLAVTFVFAFVCEKIFERVHFHPLFVLMFLWYAIYPVNNIYSVTMWKDVLFSVIFLIFLLCMDSASDHEEVFFSSRSKCLFFFLSLLLLPLFRHNGIFITAVMTIYLPFRFRNSRRKVMLLCLGVLLLFGCWKGLILPALNAKPIPSQEYLSTPLQQIARVFANHHEELSEEVKETAAPFFDLPEFWTVYLPILSDEIRSHLNSSYYEENRDIFFTLWKQLGKQYPLEYLEAFLHNHYGYSFPEANYWISSYGVITGKHIADVETAPIRKDPIVDRIYNWYAYHHDKDYPLVPLLFKPGACWWLWLFCGAYSLYTNRKKFILFLTGVFLWLTIQFSAVFCEYRYVYGLFIGLPLLIVSVFTTQDTR